MAKPIKARKPHQAYEENESIPQVKKDIVHKKVTRTMSGKKDVFTDLFKLQTATVIKYEGWNEKEEHPDTHPAKFSHWEHTHPFRTFDKKGEKNFVSTPIGGHFHVVEWEENPNKDEPPIVKSVSGPMVMGKQRIRGKITNVPVPANEFDEHTHEIEYLRTDTISISTTNTEAQAVIAMIAQKGAPVPGVQG
jgi:hypothetical protein